MLKKSRGVLLKVKVFCLNRDMSIGANIFAEDIKVADRFSEIFYNYIDALDVRSACAEFDYQQFVTLLFARAGSMG